jgi:hypothetical protein
MDDKIHFVFNMYDVSHDNTVSKQDLTTLLNQIPKGALGAYDYAAEHQILHPPHSPMPGDLSRLRSGSGSSLSQAESTEENPAGAGTPGAGGGHSRDPSVNMKAGAEGTGAPVLPQFGTAPGILERGESAGLKEGGGAATPAGGVATEFDYEDVDFYTNHDMVEKAFQECDLNHEGRLTYEEFKMWVQRTPTIMEYIESILPYNGPKDMSAHHHKRETLPHLRRIASRMSMGRGKTVDELAGEVFNHSTSTHPHPGLKQRTLSMRMSSGQPGNARHSMSMQHLTLNMANVAGSAPHSPMVPGSTPASVAGGTAANTSGGMLSRASSFGFPTPVPASTAHGNGGGVAGDRFSVDLAGLGKC